MYFGDAVFLVRRPSFEAFQWASPVDLINPQELYLLVAGTHSMNLSLLFKRRPSEGIAHLTRVPSGRHFQERIAEVGELCRYGKKGEGLHTVSQNRNEPRADNNHFHY